MGMSETARQGFVTLIEDLNRIKGYREETLFMAQSIGDQYLVHLVVHKQPLPCFGTLSIICNLLSAKLCQNIHPSFDRMIDLAKEIWEVEIQKADLLELEYKIITVLNFDFSYESPLVFLERFQRLYGLDRLADSENIKEIDMLARALIRFTFRNSASLSIFPSHIAAASLILAINIGLDPLSLQIGLPSDKMQPNLERIRRGGTFFESD